MRILLYGECNKTGSGAWCYAEAFRAAGHAVKPFCPAAGIEGWDRHLIWRLWRRIHPELPSYAQHRHQNIFQAAITESKPDLIVVLKGLWVSAESIALARQRGSRVILINHDDFFSRNRFNWSSVQRRALQSYDKIYATRRINVTELRGLGLEADFFPFSFEPCIHRRIERAKGCLDARQHDVVFVGTYERDRAALLEELVRQTNLRVAIYGEQWHRLGLSNRLRRCIRPGFLAGDAFCQVIGDAGCALGFLRKENRDEYTQRSLEIPACGGLFVAERTEEHRRMFVEGRDAEFFEANSPSEMIAKVLKVCRRPEIGVEMRHNGMNAVHALRYTYADRVRQIFDDFR